MTLIRADNKLNDTDSEQDIWAQPIPPYALDNHSISIELRDEASRFNINNLYQNGAVNTAALAVFQRLLTQLNLESDIAIAVLDYQDADGEVYQDGGDESVVYSQQRSGRAVEGTLPNQPFISIDQLQDVRGVSAEVLAALRPYLTAVPYYVPINVNTASPELLASLADGVTSEQMRGSTEMRRKQVLPSIDELWQLPILGGLNEEQRAALTPLLAVDSQAFTALITATDSANTGQTRQRFATVLISKTATDDGETENSSDANSNNKNSDNANSTGNDNKSKKAKSIKVITQRLWAFRPSF